MVRDLRWEPWGLSRYSRNSRLEGLTLSYRKVATSNDLQAVTLSVLGADAKSGLGPFGVRN